MNQLAGRTDIVVTCLVAFGVVYMLQSVYIADNYRKSSEYAQVDCESGDKAIGGKEAAYN